MNKTKFVKTAKVIDKILNVVQKITVVATIVSSIMFAIFAVVCFVMSDALIGTEFNVFDIGILTFEVAEGVTPNNNAMLTYTLTLLITAVISMPLFYYFLKVIRKVLKPMTEGNPFSSSVSKDVKKLAIVSLIVGITDNIFIWAMTFATMHLYNIEKVIESSNITSLTANYTFDLSFIAVFFVLLLLSYIFKYGEGLHNSQMKLCKGGHLRWHCLKKHLKTKMLQKILTYHILQMFIIICWECFK